MWGVTAVNILIVMLTVILQYECLLRLNSILPRLKGWSRFRLVIGVFGAMVAHAVEVWCFALAYRLMIAYTDWGHLKGQFDGSLLDCVYFSFTTFTTIGFGYIQPDGALKFLTGLEA